MRALHCPNLLACIFIIMPDGLGRSELTQNRNPVNRFQYRTVEPLHQRSISADQRLYEIVCWPYRGVLLKMHRAQRGGISELRTEIFTFVHRYVMVRF